MLYGGDVHVWAAILPQSYQTAHATSFDSSTLDDCKTRHTIQGRCYLCLHLEHTSISQLYWPTLAAAGAQAAPPLNNETVTKNVSDAHNTGKNNRKQVQTKDAEARRPGWQKANQHHGETKNNRDVQPALEQEGAAHQNS